MMLYVCVVFVKIIRTQYTNEYQNKYRYINCEKDTYVDTFKMDAIWMCNGNENDSEIDTKCKIW